MQYVIVLKRLLLFKRTCLYSFSLHFIQFWYQNKVSHKNCFFGSRHSVAEQFFSFVKMPYKFLQSTKFLVWILSRAIKLNTIRKEWAIRMKKNVNSYWSKADWIAQIHVLFFFVNENENVSFFKKFISICREVNLHHNLTGRMKKWES